MNGPALTKSRTFSSWLQNMGKMWFKMMVEVIKVQKLVKLAEYGWMKKMLDSLMNWTFQFTN